MKKKSKYLFLLLLTSCMSEPDEIKGFNSDYTVYDYEIESEYLGDYRVQYVDLDEIENNIDKKEQLKNQYLLYISDTNYIHVSPNHPDENLKLILSFYKKYKSDSTYLDEFQIENNKINITIKKKREWLYKSWYSGDTITEMKIDFEPWKDIYFQKENGNWKLKKEEFNYFWPDKNN